MEAPDQRYVFARSFPAVNFNKFSLYKVKSMVMDCGHYTCQQHQEHLFLHSGFTPAGTCAGTFVHMDMHSLTPFLQKIPTLGTFGPCLSEFYKMMNREWIDTVSAYKLHNSDCGVMLVAGVTAEST